MFWIQIQRYIVSNFQVWSKMTLKIKTIYSPFLEADFEKFFVSNM